MKKRVKFPFLWSVALGFWVSCGTASAAAPGGAGDPAPQGSSGAGSIVIPSIPGVPKIFLPDIGIAGDFAFSRDNLPETDPRYSASGQQPRIRNGQVVFFSPIDPYANAQVSVSIPEGGSADIEEAWVYFNKLPGGAGLRVGRFLPQFGLLDLLDTFQLPMADRPNAIGNYLGSDGLNATGAEVNAYLPNPWDWDLKLNLSASRGDALGGPADTTDLAYMATVDYSRDLFATGSLESGVSVAQGPSPFGRYETLEEPYLQIQYSPTQRRVWTWSAEGLLAQRHGLGSEDGKSGFYTFLDYNFARFYHVGLLADWADQAAAPYGRQLSFGPNVSWFVSGNTRLRLQYTHTTPVGPLEPEDKVTLQATFSLGNLKQLD